jgi:hypothetical protein
MQGVFNRDKQLSVDADLLRPLTQVRKEKVPPAPPAGAAAAPAIREEVVYPPVQNFLIGKNKFFIVNDLPGAVPGQYYAKTQVGGYWVVPFIKVAGNGRALAIKDPLPAEIKDGAVLGGLNPPPDLDYSKKGTHYLERQDTFYDVLYDELKQRLDEAEKLDYDFAVRMQGLQNCNINAVWTCVDLGFDASDRNLMMAQFLKGYVGRFLTEISQRPGPELDPDSVVREAIQMHERFCEAWVKEHKRGLSPLVESCAEALVGNFCDGALRPALNLGMTRKEVSRLLRRHPVFAPQFGLCLHFYMTKLDQDRSGRNANYKSMFNAMNSNVLAFKTFDNFMRSNAGEFVRLVRAELATEQDRWFHAMTTDWYGIVTQLHAPTVKYTGVRKRKPDDFDGPGDSLGAGGVLKLWS